MNQLTCRGFILGLTGSVGHTSNHCTTKAHLGDLVYVCVCSDLKDRVCSHILILHIDGLDRSFVMWSNENLMQLIFVHYL